MINPAKAYTTDEYIEILRRRMWFIIIPFVVIFLGASLYALFAPREYKASTLVLVSPQRVPEAYVQATVTSKVEERLQSIAQEVMSRTRLEQVISEFRLYEKQRQGLSMEEVVALMQTKIKVELPTKRDEKGHFTISYISSDPNMATTVANRLASLFIEENLKLREQQAVGTTEFLATELTTAKTKLDELETALTQYKRRFMGQLPEQRDTNIRILEQLQNQYQRVGESLRAAQDRKLFIQKQMTDMEMPVASSAGLEGGGGSHAAQKDALNKTLEDLRTKYTDNHPDVMSTRRKLADLEKKKDVDSLHRDPRYRELKNQLTTTDMDIKRLSREESMIADKIGGYRGRIEQIPFREQDMASLLREHTSMKETYERLLKKSQDAQQAENLEKRQKGEQFRVIDPARTPEKPFSPDIPKILLVGLLAGLGGGFGLAFVREQIDRSFYDAGDVEIALGLKVLAAIPRIEDKTA